MIDFSSELLLDNLGLVLIQFHHLGNQLVLFIYKLLHLQSVIIHITIHFQNLFNLLIQQLSHICSGLRAQVFAQDEPIHFI